MTKQLLQKNWSPENLTKVIVENHMAPIIVSSSADNQVSLEGLLYINEPDEDFDSEDYINSEFNAGVLRIELDEVDEMDGREARSSQLKLTIPEFVS